MDFSERIKAFQAEKGWTSDELARRAEVSITSVSNWRTGRKKPDKWSMKRLIGLGFKRDIPMVSDEGLFKGAVE